MAPRWGSWQIDQGELVRMANPGKRIFQFRGAWSGWILFGFFLALTAAAYGLGHLNSSSTPSLSDDLSLLIAFGIFSAVGSLIVANRPANPIGWLFYAAGMGGIFSTFAAEYARYAILTHPGSLPAGTLIGAFSNVSWIFFIPVLIFLPLLFPTGRPSSPHWRWVGWLGGISWITIVIAVFQNPTISVGEGGVLGVIDNPLALPGAAQVFEQIGIFAYLAALLSAALAVISLIFRFRRAALQERLQIKWFTFAILLLVSWWGFGEVYSLLGGEIPSAISNLSFALLISLLPITTAMGILKYRLYDIDLIIQRTLVFGALTATLALVYFGSVTLAQSLFVAVTSQQSPAAIVISTLAIASLFNPLHRRIQNAIDRRFYRRKYDAEKALAAFSHTVRVEVDLENLSKALLAVVEETMKPDTASLWLSETAAGMAGSNKSALSIPDYEASR